MKNITKILSISLFCVSSAACSFSTESSRSVGFSGYKVRDSFTISFKPDNSKMIEKFHSEGVFHRGDGFCYLELRELDGFSHVKIDGSDIQIPIIKVQQLPVSCDQSEK